MHILAKIVILKQ